MHETTATASINNIIMLLLMFGKESAVFFTLNLYLRQTRSYFALLCKALV